MPKIKWLLLLQADIILVSSERVRITQNKVILLKQSYKSSYTVKREAFFPIENIFWFWMDKIIVAVAGAVMELSGPEFLSSFGLCLMSIIYSYMLRFHYSGTRVPQLRLCVYVNFAFSLPVSTSRLRLFPGLKWFPRNLPSALVYFCILL